MCGCSGGGIGGVGGGGWWYFLKYIAKERGLRFLSGQIEIPGFMR